MSAPSEQHPVYTVISERPGSNLHLIQCDEGWRSTVVASAMYKPVADWICAQLQGQPMPHVPERDAADAKLWRTCT